MVWCALRMVCSESSAGSGMELSFSGRLSPVLRPFGIAQRVSGGSVLHTDRKVVSQTLQEPRNSCVIVRYCSEP
jgi:hypothetical protein